MPRIRHLLLLLLSLPLSACTAATESPPLPEEDIPAQIHLPADRMVAAWIPYFSAERLLTAGEPQQAVSSYLQQLRDFGINTVFVHAAAFGESIYPSVYYPQLPALNGQDGLQIFSDACAENQIALHAWINPLRLQTEAVMEQQTGDAALCTWFKSSAFRSANLNIWDGRYYLDPTTETTGKFLTGVVTELMLRYHPAGIHADDYFYPTTAPEFDADTFAASGAADLGDWRRGHITALMQQMYKAVHAADDHAVFSVSPQGDLQKNRDTLYADVAAWCESGGCCDLVIPQLYYGYRHGRCPFAEMLRAWVMLPRSDAVQMAAGLGIYKYGQTDPNAGSGADEWCTSEKLPAVQTEDVLTEPSLCGVAYYHADALLELPGSEAAALKKASAQH